MWVSKIKLMASSVKQCSRCGELKGRAMFHKHRTTSDKRFPYCKVCHDLPDHIHQNLEHLKRCVQCRVIKKVTMFHPRTHTCIECAKTQSEDLKWCSRCGKVKQRTEFTSNSSRVDRLAVACKICENKRHALKRKKPVNLNLGRLNRLKSCKVCNEAKPFREFDVSIPAVLSGCTMICKTCLIGEDDE
jgi:hypothetical protein